MTDAKPWIEIVATYGLGNVLSVALALTFGWLLRYVLKETSEQRRQTQTMIDGSLRNVHDTMILQHSQEVAFWSRLEEANKHQRDEHEELLRAIQRVAA